MVCFECTPKNSHCKQQLGLPDGRYFTGLAGIVQRPVKRRYFENQKSVPEAGFLKMNNLPQLQKELTQNF